MGKIKYLDGLKGLGALMVFFCHYNLMGFPAPDWFHDSYFSKLFASGGFAVAFFLIISGFTAWMSVNRKIDDRKLLAKMLINRYLRFSVPFGFAFVLMYIGWYAGIFDGHIEVGKLTGSVTLQNAFWPVNIVGFVKSLLLSPINSDFWDAPLWMMKYVFLGTYVAVLLRLGIDVITPQWQVVALLFVLLLFGIGDIFFMGVVLGILLSYLNVAFKKQVKSHIGGAMLLVLFLCLRWNFPLNVSVELSNFIMATIFLFAIYLLPLLQKILETDLFQFLGRVSFSVFIFHWPILGSLTSFLYLKVIGLPCYEAFVIVFGITFLAVLVFSYFSEKYIEGYLSKKTIELIDNILFQGNDKI